MGAKTPTDYLYPTLPALVAKSALSCRTYPVPIITKVQAHYMIICASKHMLYNVGINVAYQETLKEQLHL